MSKTFTKTILNIFLITTCSVSFGLAQTQTIQITGKVFDKDTGSPISGVSITVKGTASATSTDNEGKYLLNTTEKPPFIIVASYVGYNPTEYEVLGNKNNLDFVMQTGIILGEEVVISASRTPERILESPVSVERMGGAAIREIATPSFYDALSSMKGVETSTQSLTFKSINTRGFNSNGNTRFNQFVDGMDNQAPGLNFSVGNIVGINDLDLDNVELLPGAASALYGAGGISGTMLMTSKNPFAYQGASFQLKTGVNHVDDSNIGNQEYKQFDLRVAKAWNNKFAFKGAFSFLQAQDWQADNYSNFDRASRRVIEGNRQTDPNYDGVNVYGDETNTNLLGVARGLQEGFAAQSPAGAAAFNGLVTSGLSYQQAVSTINSNPAYASLRPALPFLGVFYSLQDGAIPSQDVSRTGYNEVSLVDYDTRSLKTSGSVHYKITSALEAIAQVNWGTGTSVYTGADRYSLRNFSIGQYKLELKSPDFFLRGYTTQERSGDSYISSILGAYINEAYRPSEGAADDPVSGWFAQYALAYSGARAQGVDNISAHNMARAVADNGRLMPGTPEFEAVKRTVVNNTISSGVGAKFDDRSNLYHYEGMYNFSNALNEVVELQIGGSYRIYQLRSAGTIFDDLNGGININEYGAFAQLGKRVFDNKLKISLSGRYDKSTNFDGRFTPRVSGVFTVAPNNNIRVSFQTGYRNPTTQDQYIDLSVAGGRQRLIGGLPASLNKYNLFSNLAYTDVSFRTFLESVASGTPNPGLLKPYTFDSKGIVPESVNSYEMGYKGLLGTKLLIDAYIYYSTFKNFNTAVEVYQQNDGAFSKFGVPVNVNGEVNTYGAALGMDYLLLDYNISGNISYNQIGDLPEGYINDFNTPTVRFNLGLGNRAVIKNVGFNINYRWQDSFYWTSSFAAGTVPKFGTLDGQINLKVPSVNTILKIGGSNLLNKYYFTSYGNPSVGALYYVGLTYNP